VILGYVDVLLEETPSDDPRSEILTEVKQAATRSAELTKRLLAFTRQQPQELVRVVELNAVVEATSTMLRRLVGDDVTLLVSVDARPCRTRAEPAQIEQVLMNLVLNARDAMPTGGLLMIDTSVDDAGAGSYVRLSVSDRGVGMSPETRKRVFEPFFTTKPLGKGTGLGLATVFAIVQQCGGRIEVESELGAGSRFHLYFPRVDEIEQVETTPSGKPAQRGETILVVDDEDSLRALMRKVLVRSGYRVLEAADGEGALAVAERHPDRIHLLLTDVIMPRMSGRQLADALLALRPEMKVLYVSGYTNDVVLDRGVESGSVSFLQKPVAPAALTKEVRSLLDSARPAP
jgi:two-component system cell cycle sensor histidine kinase/response regulator CckA